MKHQLPSELPLADGERPSHETAAGIAAWCREASLILMRAVTDLDGGHVNARSLAEAVAARRMVEACADVIRARNTLVIHRPEMRPDNRPLPERLAEARKR
jgi:hypothetical protein